MGNVSQGLAITLVSDESDAKILNDVQERFDVNITELPDEIDLASYSKLKFSKTRFTLDVVLKVNPKFLLPVEGR